MYIENKDLCGNLYLYFQLLQEFSGNKSQQEINFQLKLMVLENQRQLQESEHEKQLFSFLGHLNLHQIQVHF